MATKLSITEDDKGSTVTFTSKNPNDPTLYEGVVEGIVTESIAVAFSDLQSYNEAVILADSSVSTDTSDLTFFLLRLSAANTTTGKSTVIAFANEWITEGSISVLAQTTVYTIDVYDSSDTDASNIIQLLRNGGYKAKLISTSS